MISSPSLLNNKWVLLLRTHMQQAKSWARTKFKKQPKRLSTSFDWLSSSIRAMDISNQLKQVFNLIDANGDGKISSSELGNVLVCLGHERNFAEKAAEGMVREVDCNGDGFIDLEEFMEVVDGGSSREELMDVFLIFDSDKNGFISAKELQKVLISLGYDKCTLNECFMMIRGVDKDGDGLVDFEEFWVMMNRCRE